MTIGMEKPFVPRGRGRLKALLAALVPAFLQGCGRLDSLVVDTTPGAWLASHPWLKARVFGAEFVLAEPSSTLFVYGLGVVLAVAGIVFLKARSRGVRQVQGRTSGHTAGGASLLAWGAGLLLWSVATFSAGTSYQAFSYEIKFAGRAQGLWTSWWEIAYLGLFVASMDLLAVAVALSSSRGRLRRLILAFAGLDAVAYLALLLAGAFLPDRFLASFEFMVLFVAPVFLLLFTVNLARWLKTRSRLELRLLLSWVGLFLVLAAYYACFLSGLSEALWARGIWFNANDVLHLGLVGWVLWIMLGLRPHVRDAE